MFAYVRGVGTEPNPAQYTVVDAGELSWRDEETLGVPDVRTRSCNFRFLTPPDPTSISTGMLGTGADVSCATTLDRAMLGAVLRPLTGAPSCVSLQTTCPALSAAVMPGTSGA